ncbi:hypothetical protein [uncultured Imperialibacter sp.]|uniref:hypothetical protein n=1 Tax=uncultured Imperialibacter sp. TaxID=1672639 RepID=UPI0030D7A004|tara:strand:- start:15346 stop:16227 length:882 start_codon:yes stop_codon:yes gene_type:complete
MKIDILSVAIGVVITVLAGLILIVLTPFVKPLIPSDETVKGFYNRIKSSPNLVIKGLALLLRGAFWVVIHWPVIDKKRRSLKVFVKYVFNAYHPNYIFYLVVFTACFPIIAPMSIFAASSLFGTDTFGFDDPIIFQSLNGITGLSLEQVHYVIITFALLRIISELSIFLKSQEFHNQYSYNLIYFGLLYKKEIIDSNTLINYENDYERRFRRSLSSGILDAAATLGKMNSERQSIEKYLGIYMVNNLTNKISPTAYLGFSQRMDRIEEFKKNVKPNIGGEELPGSFKYIPFDK